MPEEILTAVVPAELEGKRLDQALSILCPQHSRARLQAWIKAGRVTVNHRVVQQRDRVRAGLAIEVRPLHEVRECWRGEALPLHIIHQDNALIVLDKPPGLVVHPGAGNREHTLLNALLHHDPELARVARAGIVQRLDKDTSGIMVVARTPESHTCLVEQLRRRSITRVYQALVTGTVTAGGTVDAPIGRHPVRRKRMAVVDNGKPARTHFRVLRRFRAHTLLELQLETGRTHQIRVHLAHLRCPVTGDPVYGSRRRLPGGISPALRTALRAFPRQALHAWRLELIHPVSGRRCAWNAALPADMRALLEVLEADDGGSGDE